MPFANEMMNKAILLAQDAGSNGNYPVAAVVATQDEVLAFTGSSLVKSCDPSAHPELVAIRSACEKRQSRYIPDAYLFTTLEPCPMCTSAAIWAKMKGIYFATNQSDAYAVAKSLEGTQFTFRQIDVPCRDIVNAGHPPLELYEDYERTKMLDVYEDFVFQIKSSTI